MNVILVPGTWGDNDLWWRMEPGSFADSIQRAGHTVIGRPGREFCWSTNLSGFDIGRRDLKDWEAGGRHLRDYLDPVLCQTPLDPASLVIVAHSHGRQVTKYALAAGLHAQTVIFVSGPIRHDVDKATVKAKANTCRIICINGEGWGDKMQWFGEVGDGAWGWTRKDAEADQCVTFPKATHSGLLNTPALHHNVIDFIL